MTRLTWAATGERRFEAGVDRGVFYPYVGPGVPWNGLLSVSEKASGDGITPYYFDSVMYALNANNADFAATIQVVSYPEEFEAALGNASMASGLFFGMQPKTSFGLSYRTLIGNELQGTDHGYKLHIVYNAKTASNNRSIQTLSNTANPSSFNFDILCRPIPVEGFRDTAHIYLDSTKASPSVITAVENILYGSEGIAPRLPHPTELIELL